MPASDTGEDQVEQLQNQLVAALRTIGGHAGNTALQRELNWPNPDDYWQIRDRLVDSGTLELGKGKGGSVTLVQMEPVIPRGDQASETAESPQQVSEASLYEPIAEVLRNDWSRHMRFTNHLVEITASQGRRQTGGTWTRPDIVVAAMRAFAHVPGKYFDLITFEVKPLSGTDVTAVFEALSHRRAATQAYVWLHIPEALQTEAEIDSLLTRIEAEARRHGIGLIVGADPARWEAWDLRLLAVRQEPDPDSLNTFIAQQMTSLAHTSLAVWFR